MTTSFGATYSTNPETFGQITHVFEVAPDWDGYRYHGYCVPTRAEIAAFAITCDLSHLPDPDDMDEYTPSAQPATAELVHARFFAPGHPF